MTVFFSGTPLQQRLARRLFYGWAIVAVAMLGIFASGPAQSHTFSVFVGPIALSATPSQSAHCDSWSPSHAAGRRA